MGATIVKRQPATYRRHLIYLPDTLADAGLDVCVMDVVLRDLPLRVTPSRLALFTTSG